MDMTTRITIFSGYNRPAQHRKIELLADTPGLDILNILPAGSGKPSGAYPSANGQRQYRTRELPLHSLGRAGDPHRIFHWPPSFQLRQFQPHIIQCEYEQEGVLAAEVALARRWLARHSQLILNSAQNLLRPRRWAVRAIGAFTLRAADHVSCWSEEAIQVLRAQGYQRSVNIMPTMGADTRCFYPKPSVSLRRQMGIQDSFVAGYVGRVVPDKGISALLRAAKHLYPAISVLVVGDGPARDELQRLAAQLGIQDHCRFIGAQPYDRLPDYFNALDVLVLPSLTTRVWKEQFGRVLVEAMACGVPVIGSDSGAIPEVIGDAGLIFPEGAAAALAECVRRLIDSPELRAELAQRGLARVMAHYTPERLAACTLDLYRQISPTL
jgi:L-malate glycosyltransferase